MSWASSFKRMMFHVGWKKQQQQQKRIRDEYNLKFTTQFWSLIYDYEKSWTSSNNISRWIYILKVILCCAQMWTRLCEGALDDTQVTLQPHTHFATTCSSLHLVNQNSTCADIWDFRQGICESHFYWLIKNRGVKYTARGPKLAHQRVQSSAWDEFAKCEN